MSENVRPCGPEIWWLEVGTMRFEMELLGLELLLELEGTKAERERTSKMSSKELESS
jgi:hypothetical protein